MQGTGFKCENSEITWVLAQVQPQLVGFVKGAVGGGVDLTDVLLNLLHSRALITKWGANHVKFGENVPRNTVVGVCCGPAVIREYALDSASEVTGIRKDSEFWMDTSFPVSRL